MVPWVAAEGGVMLAVRLTPRASKDAIDGIVADGDGRALLQLRIAAPPVEGAANAALIAFVAKGAGLRKADVTIASGDRARIKRIKLAGDPRDLAIQLERWIGPAGV